MTVELVFHQGHGTPWMSETDLDRWRVFLSSAGVGPMRVHDQRHTAATMLLQGVDMRVVMQMMGWSNVTMLNRYQHVIDEMMSEASEKMGNALFGAGSGPDLASAAGDSTVVDVDAFRARGAG